MVALTCDFNCHKKDSSKSYKNNNALAINYMCAIWVILTVMLCIGAVQTAAVYSNVDFLSNPNFEAICHAQQEHFIESEGKESSLILEFNPSAISDKRKSCTRILSAPANYGFIVRLILPKIRHSNHSQRQHYHQILKPIVPTGNVNNMPEDTTAAASSTNSNVANLNEPHSAVTTLNEMTSLIEKLNSSTITRKMILGRTCPLSVFSSLDPHTPQWRIDPCQLEDTAPEMEDPVRLFHGRVRIVWDHGQNQLHSKLMVTALGKGEQCRSEHKHPCLKIGDEPILCISKKLVCDGIRHCPYSNEYNSDEDYTMCWKQRRIDEPMPPAMESDIFEHFALEVFRNLFAFDVPTIIDDDDDTTDNSIATKKQVTVNSTTLRKVENGLNIDVNENAKNDNNKKANDVNSKTDNSTESTGNGHHRRNSTRLGLNSDLSKYGPWGYLMLGMLLCGGALLICGLWASASQHAVNNEREAMQNSVNGFNNSGADQPTGTVAPPNYEELDPPPSYSVLFPNQKAASNATLSSLMTSTSTTATSSAAANSGSSSGPPLSAATTSSSSVGNNNTNIVTNSAGNNSSGL